MGERRFLKLSAGLTAVCAILFLLIFAGGRAPFDSTKNRVFRGKVPSLPPTFKIKDSPGAAGRNADADRTIKPHETLKPSSSDDPPKAIGIQASSTAALPDTEAVSAADDKNVSGTALLPAPRQSPGGAFLEIGPIVSGRELTEVTGILGHDGFEFKQASGKGAVKVIRLLAGLYPRAQALERLKAVQAVAATAFIIPENGRFAIYAATYRDPVKAARRVRQLAKKGILVTPIATEIEMQGVLLRVSNASPSDIEIITERISPLKLSVKVDR